jgi:hypothetical protein
LIDPWETELPILSQLSFSLEVHVTDIMDDAEIELQCESCGRKTKKNIEWIKNHEEVACDCGTTIPVDVNKFRKELVKAESGLDGFQGLMETLGK